MVTINYRLGAFGYLVTSNLVQEDPILNWGIQDQRMALNFVQQNIFNFGGDPDNVMIFGESAGGASVAFHLISQLSWELYDKATLESPGPWWYFTASVAIEINERAINESGNCTSMSLECLRGLPAATISTMSFQALPVVNGVEGDLADQPYRLIRQGKFNRGRDVLIGNNAAEGTIFAYEANGATFNINQTVYEHLLNASLAASAYPPTIAEQVLKIYEPIELSQGYFLAASAFAGDFFIDCGTRNLANALYNYSIPSNGNAQTWRYVFSHHLSNWTMNGENLNILNATHGTELPFVFGQDMFGIYLDSDEFQLSKQIIEFWAQFARYGNPNGNGDSNNDDSPVGLWPAYDATNANTTIINLNSDLGLTTDVWSYTCEQLEQLIFFNSTLI